MKIDKRHYEIYSWIIRGNQRKIVFKELDTNPITAEELRKKINLNISKNIKPLSLREMSRHLNSFVENGLVECLSPNAPYNKPFVLTKLGKTIQEKLV